MSNQMQLSPTDQIKTMQSQMRELGLNQLEVLKTAVSDGIQLAQDIVDCPSAHQNGTCGSIGQIRHDLQGILARIDETYRKALGKPMPAASIGARGKDAPATEPTTWMELSDYDLLPARCEIRIRAQLSEHDVGTPREWTTIGSYFRDHTVLHNQDPKSVGLTKAQVLNLLTDHEAQYRETPAPTKVFEETPVDASEWYPFEAQTPNEHPAGSIIEIKTKDGTSAGEYVIKAGRLHNTINDNIPRLDPSHELTYRVVADGSAPWTDWRPFETLLPYLRNGERVQVKDRETGTNHVIYVVDENGDWTMYLDASRQTAVLTSKDTGLLEGFTLRRRQQLSMVTKS